MYVYGIYIYIYTERYRYTRRSTSQRDETIATPNSESNFGKAMTYERFWGSAQMGMEFAANGKKMPNQTWLAGKSSRNGGLKTGKNRKNR